jgi:hypothetical protein
MTTYKVVLTREVRLRRWRRTGAEGCKIPDIPNGCGRKNGLWLWGAGFGLMRGGGGLGGPGAPGPPR